MISTNFSKASRLSDELFLPASDSKCSRTEHSSTSLEIQVVQRTWSKLWAKLEMAQTNCDFNAKIFHLKNRCTIQDKKTCTMWIEFAELPGAGIQEPAYLLFTLHKGRYDSESLCDELLAPKIGDKDNFYTFTLELVKDSAKAKNCLNGLFHRMVSAGNSLGFQPTLHSQVNLSCIFSNDFKLI